MTRKAFTLVEVMIVVLIIGILVAIAVPNFFSARENSRQKTCLENLRQINEAKDMWSTATNATSGTVVEQADISPTYLKIFPECPAGGSYTIGAVDVNATCSYQLGRFPHTTDQSSLNANIRY